MDVKPYDRARGAGATGVLLDSPKFWRPAGRPVGFLDSTVPIFGQVFSLEFQK